MIVAQDYRHGGDIYRNQVRLDFSANGNPLGTPEPVKAAVRAAAEQLAAYPDPYCGPLREKLAARLGVCPADILCGNGAAELVFQFAQAMGDGDVLLPVPSFGEYESALRAAGRRIQPYPLQRAQGFAVPEALLSAITPATQALVLCSPNNPTGLCVPKDLLLALLNRCRETGTWLFLDECFYELTDRAQAYTILPALREGDRVFVLRAFTKAYGIAGVRLGYGVCKDHGLLAQMGRLVQPWNVSAPAQAAGLAALDCGAFLEETTALLAREKPFLMQGLTALGAQVLPGAANYLMFTGRPGLYDRLLGQGILIRGCETYRGLTDGDYRTAVRTHGENEALLAALNHICAEDDGCI